VGCFWGLFRVFGGVGGVRVFGEFREVGGKLPNP